MKCTFCRNMVNPSGPYDRECPICSHEQLVDVVPQYSPTVSREAVIEIIDKKILEQDPSGLTLESMAKQFQVPISVMALRFLDIQLEDIKTSIQNL